MSNKIEVTVKDVGFGKTFYVPDLKAAFMRIYDSYKGACVWTITGSIYRVGMREDFKPNDKVMVAKI